MGRRLQVVNVDIAPGDIQASKDFLLLDDATIKDFLYVDGPAEVIGKHTTQKLFVKSDATIKGNLKVDGELFGVFYTESEGVSTTVSTSWQTKLSLNLYPGTYIVWAHWTLGGLSAQARFGTVGVNVGEFNTNANSWNSTTITKYTVIPINLSVNIIYRTTNAVNTAGIKWARIIAWKIL